MKEGSQKDVWVIIVQLYNQLFSSTYVLIVLFNDKSESTADFI
jgi:hypothetical protein